MSLNSIEEIKQFLTTIECGEPIFSINVGYNDSVNFDIYTYIGTPTRSIIISPSY